MAKPRGRRRDRPRVRRRGSDRSPGRVASEPGKQVRLDVPAGVHAGPIAPPCRYRSSRSVNHAATAATSSASRCRSWPVAAARSHPWIRWSAVSCIGVLLDRRLTERELHDGSVRARVHGGGGIGGRGTRRRTRVVAQDSPSKRSPTSSTVLPSTSGRVHSSSPTTWLTSAGRPSRHTGSRAPTGRPRPRRPCGQSPRPLVDGARSRPWRECAPHRTRSRRMVVRGLDRLRGRLARRVRSGSGAPGTGPCRGPTERWVRRWIVCSSPTAMRLANIEDPPYDTSGRGTPVTGMIPRHIPMFWKAWNPNQQATPAAASRPKRSSACAAMRQGPPDHDAEQQDQDAGPDEPELLPRDGEDEVGLLLGDERRPCLRAVEQPLAEDPAVADRDARLLGVVAGAARVECRVREGHEPVELVVLEHARG